MCDSYQKACNAATVTMDNGIIIAIRKRAKVMTLDRRTGKYIRAYTNESIGKQYKMSEKQVRRIISGECWDMVS